MNSLRVLIYDDEPTLAEKWEADIKSTNSEATVAAADGQQFEQLLKQLNKRRSDWRELKHHDALPKEHVDEQDIIVVDYDLIKYSDTGTTGSRLAYLLRCYTGCGLIVILNEYGRNVFDLSLSTSAEDFADIHIGDAQLGNPGLWTKDFDGYRPWYWPILPDAKENFEQCVKDVDENLDTSILDFLGLTDAIYWMPQRALDFLTGKRKVEEITFKEFVESGRGGISRKDRVIPEQMARIAAARIVTLLNLIILPEQSLLVDAPHLASRFPSLLANSPHDIEEWNRLCNPDNPAIEGLLSPSLKRYKFNKTHWLWRPAWYWPEINKDEAIEEVRDPWTFQEVKWVFCENYSRFMPIEFTRSFRARVSPPFIKRFIYDIDSPNADNCISERELREPAQYEPQANFS